MSRLESFDRTLEAIDADDWGANTTSTLREYCRATMEDLRGEHFTRGDVGAYQRLSQLGAELALQHWAEVWHSVPEWQAAFADAEAAVREFRTLAQPGKAR